MSQAATEYGLWHYWVVTALWVFRDQGTLQVVRLQYPAYQSSLKGILLDSTAEYLLSACEQGAGTNIRSVPGVSDFSTGSDAT